MTDQRIARTIDTMVAAGERVVAAEHSAIRLALGPTVVEIDFVPHRNKAGVSIEGAFTLVDVDGAPDFRLIVVDDSITGCSPVLDWPQEWHLPFGIARDEHSGPYRFAIDFHSQSLCVYDSRVKQAVVWYHDIEQISYWFAATPFRLQLSWFADSFGGEMIHAAGLDLGSRAALIVGPSGAGKSTLTMAAMLEGVPILGDDFLLLSGLTAQAVYGRTKVHDATVAILGESIGRIGPVMNAGTTREKRIIDTDRGRISTAPLPIAAIFIPRISDDARVRSISAAKALRSTLGPTQEGLLGGSPGTLQRVASLVRSVPAFEIEVGPDMKANARALIQAAESVRPVGISPGITAKGGAE